MKIGDKVQKTKGYSWPGVIVADFTTLSGQRRLVVECTTPEVAGALHIYNADQLELVEQPHPFGPNGHIVDAFIAHSKSMTAEQWDAAWDAARTAARAAARTAARAAARTAARAAAWDAARTAARTAARAAAWDAARDAARDAAEDAAGAVAWAAAWAAAGCAAAWAANEIQGADLLRERGQPFYFLPMFGFADEKAIPLHIYNEDQLEKIA